MVNQVVTVSRARKSTSRSRKMKMLYDEISRLQEDNRKLREELKSVKFDEHFLEHGNSMKKIFYRLS